ncbi:KIF-binding protein-like [Amphiura filiformis]
MPEKLENDVLRPAMVAYFCMARLHSKVITLDLQMGLSCMSQSLELYGKVVNYCTKHPESIQRVEAEYELCKEMVDLLPVRMDRLRSNMVQ